MEGISAISDEIRQKVDDSHATPAVSASSALFGANQFLRIEPPSVDLLLHYFSQIELNSSVMVDAQQGFDLTLSRWGSHARSHATVLKYPAKVPVKKTIR